jgi:AraC-like DNA-binding protein
VESDNHEDTHPQSEFVERRRLPRVPLAPLGEDAGKPNVLTPQIFSSENLEKPQQFRAWREHLAPVFDVRLPDTVSADDGFTVRQAIWNLGGMLLVQQSAPPFSFERSREQVRFSPIDHWQITFLRAGQTWTAVDMSVAENRPGMVEIRSLGQPFRGRAIATESVSLIIPVDRFAARGGLPEASHHVVLGGHRAKLMIDFVSSVEDSLGRLTQEGLGSVRSSLIEIVFDTVSSLVGTSGEPDPVSNVGLMTRARRYIQTNLASEELTPDALSRELAISRTRLYELFENSGGVLKYIRERRLLAAHAMLTNVSDTRKIADIAATFGFDSAANFSRAFTQQFGYSPSSVRRLPPRFGAQTEVPASPSQPATFEALLRNLDPF